MNTLLNDYSRSGNKKTSFNPFPYSHQRERCCYLDDDREFDSFLGAGESPKGPRRNLPSQKMCGSFVSVRKLGFPDGYRCIPGKIP
jgi:hypothetical protein